MDDRQTQIREGAGLEDSRINKEFLDFLNKWSSPVLIVLAIAALVWAGLQKLDQMKKAKVDQAFSELEGAIAGGNPSPTSLTSIAETYDGVRAVPELARLMATDIYLNGFAIGLEPTAQFDRASGEVQNPDDILNAERRQQFLQLAESTARSVLQSSEGNKDKLLFEMQALSKLAVIMEGKEDFDGARQYYERLKETGTREQYPAIASFAEARIAQLDALQTLEPLPTNEQVPALPGSGLPSGSEAPISQEQIEQLLQQQLNADGAAADSGEGPSTTDGTDSEPEDSESP